MHTGLGLGYTHIHTHRRTRVHTFSLSSTLEYLSAVVTQRECGRDVCYRYGAARHSPCDKTLTVHSARPANPTCTQETCVYVDSCTAANHNNVYEDRWRTVTLTTAANTATTATKWLSHVFSHFTTISAKLAYIEMEWNIFNISIAQNNWMIHNVQRMFDHRLDVCVCVLSTVRCLECFQVGLQGTDHRHYILFTKLTLFIFLISVDHKRHINVHPHVSVQVSVSAALTCVV